MNGDTLDRAAQRMASVRDCVLALMDSDGFPTAAVITPTKTQGIRQVFIGNSIHSNWVKRAGACDRASLCYHTSQPECNITLVGTIEVVTGDMALKKEMWSDWMEQYYTGPEDPGFCVLRFTTKRYSIFMEGQQVRGTL